MTVKRFTSARGVTLTEIIVTMVVIAIGVIGAGAYRYHSALAVRRANVQISAARLCSLLLHNWKGLGGHSGYYRYDPNGDDPIDPNDYDPNYDYVSYNPADYDYDFDDTNDITLGSALNIYDNAPGPNVPDGFSPLDSASNPNYRIVVNGVHYYATLSYKDEVGEPRSLNVRVAWTDDYRGWSDLERYHMVSLTTYAND